MNDNKPFDAVEDLVSLEALSAIDAALAQEENAPSNDHERKSENQLVDDSPDTSA